MTQTLPATPGQTVGPFFGYALPFDGGPELVTPGSAGAIRLCGRVLDGAGEPVPDALLEIWQRDDTGRVIQQQGSLRRDGWTFTGFGRTATDNLGQYCFTTVLPGAPGPGRASFIAMTIFARGLLNRLFTRVYLPGDDDALVGDPLLSSLDPQRRDTLMASPCPGGFQFDVVLQGAAETVFLTYPRHRQ